jgi:hypothetical protein
VERTAFQPNYRAQKLNKIMVQGALKFGVTGDDQVMAMTPKGDRCQRYPLVSLGDSSYLLSHHVSHKVSHVIWNAGPFGHIFNDTLLRQCDQKRGQGYRWQHITIFNILYFYYYTSQCTVLFRVRNSMHCTSSGILPATLNTRIATQVNTPSSTSPVYDPRDCRITPAFPALRPFFEP